MRALWRGGTLNSIDMGSKRMVARLSRCLNDLEVNPATAMMVTKARDHNDNADDHDPPTTTAETKPWL